MKPGDLIEWVCRSDQKVVPTDEELYSSTMGDWVPIGAPAMLVSIDEKTYSWLSPKGLFRANVGDCQCFLLVNKLLEVFPRKVQT